jgi:hypothetical protein
MTVARAAAFAAVAASALPPALAAGWEFGERLAVTPVHGHGIFHHLDSAGRRGIAVNERIVAVVWEDNRDGRPRVMAAFLADDGDGFVAETAISDGDEAYEPVVAAIDGGAFLAAWEQNRAIHARLLRPGQSGPVAVLGGAGRQVTLAAAAGGLAYAAYVDTDGDSPGGPGRIRVLALDGSSGRVVVAGERLVEEGGSAAPQLYPAAAETGQALCVAWEDRRFGHTRLLWSLAPADQPFTAPQALNEFRSDRNPYDLGSGVTRVVMTAFGEGGVAAAWMDKRDPGKSYAIYGALSRGGCSGFGTNLKIHDGFGDDAVHYNPAVGGHAAGDRVVAWDDDRDGTADVWIAWPEENGWSFNEPVTPAATASEESNAVVTLDGGGDLHIAWIERAGPGAPTRLWYARGKR